MWPFVTGYFYLHDIFEVRPCCSMYQYFIPFYGQIILHCVDISHIVYPFISW